ncbi:hypothetical protein LINPERHAP2_LOCUS38575 [Linum perenne]
MCRLSLFVEQFKPNCYCLNLNGPILSFVNLDVF